MAPYQKKKFTKLCGEMADLLSEIQNEHPDATLFIENGSVNIYDWPGAIERRPDEPLARGCYWHKASGGAQ